MSIADSIISEIVKRILLVLQPEMIILFGSAASERMTKDSDIDLLIVERETDGLREKRLLVRKKLEGVGYAFDIIIMPRQLFEETKNVIGGIAYPAHKYGKVIYEIT